ncbi:hypothetical protein O0L34_g12777 [Tuta absoluta]|nr:hypothetical protein O0L34_g12777 [Tuta absoluta]
MFPGCDVNTRWAFALTWLVLFVVAVLFEGSKVYLARVQREAHKRLYPYRSDERRNLLCEREPAPVDGMEATTSRNASAGVMNRWSSLRVRMLVNFHQSFVFLLHNIVGYLLMLAVMIYNVHLLVAVVLGMMLGYFLFGTSLTRLQMQCFATKRHVICTPECDDTADHSTPPLLDASLSSESDFFICRTRTCIQPSHYFPANTAGASGDAANATCYYGAKACPSRVARAKKVQASSSPCRHTIEKEDSPSVEDAQLLRAERQGCCGNKQETPPPPTPETKCCKKSSQPAEVVVVHQDPCCKSQADPSSDPDVEREDSPQITCCHSAKTAPAESQEEIVSERSS